MSKTVKSGKTKTKSGAFSETTPVMFAMGHVDLIFSLNLSDKDLEKENPESKNEQNDGKQKGNQEDRYYKLEDLTSIQSLNFMKDKKEIWDKIILKGGNDTIKQLLIGNKVSKKKCHIDYIGYGRPKFEGEEEFFDEIYNYVTSKYHLTINKTPLDEGNSSSLTIILKHKGKTQTINVGKSQEEEEKENRKKKKKKNNTNEKDKKDKKEKKDKKDNKEEDEEEEEEEDSDDDEDEEDDEEEEKKEDDYEETEAMKDKKIPKFKRGSSVLVNLNPSYSKYDMVYINYSDCKKIPGDFKMRDLLELLKFFKSKGSTLFVNFYKPKKKKVQEEPEEPEDTHENDNAIMAEGKTRVDQEENKEEEEEKKPEKKNKKREGPSRKMIELNQLYDFTNIFFFDTKQCGKIFNKHYETFTEDNIYNRKKISKSKIYDYFIKGISTATKEEVSGTKVGLFLDNLNKFTIILTSKKAANKQEFDSQPYPKVNHTNIELIKAYKKILKKNKNDYYSILISNIVINCAANSPNCMSSEIIYPGFLIALEIIKKKLECEKNNLEQDESIYKVKISDKIISKDLEKFASGGKENGFVLDCTNKKKSTMKNYVSLYDYHLKSFFSSDLVRKDLKSKGFINTQGFIMYDPMHRDVMGIKTEKKKKKETNEEKKDKVLSSIQGIDVPSNIKDKEIDAEKAALTKNTPTDKKLPFSKDTMSTVSSKKKKRRHKKRTGSNVGGSSGDISSSGNNSGIESGNEEFNSSVEKTEG